MLAVLCLFLCLTQRRIGQSFHVAATPKMSSQTSFWWSDELDWCGVVFVLHAFRNSLLSELSMIWNQLYFTAVTLGRLLKPSGFAGLQELFQVVCRANGWSWSCVVAIDSNPPMNIVTDAGSTKEAADDPWKSGLPGCLLVITVSFDGEHLCFSKRRTVREWWRRG